MNDLFNILGLTDLSSFTPDSIVRIFFFLIIMDLFVLACACLGRIK